MDMPVRTAVRLGIVASMALLVLAPADRAFAQSGGAAKKKPGPSRNIYAKITKAVKGGKTVETDMTGMGDMPFKDTWRYGGYLVGLDISYGTFAGSKLMIRSVRAIYQTADGQKRGALRGVPSAVTKRILAKPGYAIGRITVSAGLNVDGLEVTFMRVEGDALNPDDSYKSEWYGSKGLGKGKDLGGDGSLVIGIFGKTTGLKVQQHQLQGLGLIQMKPD